MLPESPIELARLIKSALPRQIEWVDDDALSRLSVAVVEIQPLLVYYKRNRCLRFFAVEIAALLFEVTDAVHSDCAEFRAAWCFEVAMRLIEAAGLEPKAANPPDKWVRNRFVHLIAKDGDLNAVGRFVQDTWHWI